jgi:hypothetical protein
LVVGGQAAALSAFAVAAMAMSLTLFGLAAVIGLARDSTIQTLRGSGRLVKRWSGAILMLIGAWLIALALLNKVLLPS